MRDSESPGAAAETDPLLADVLAALEAGGVSRTGFGFRVAGDPTLVGKMERGRKIKKPRLRNAIQREVAAIRERVAAEQALD